MPLICLSCAWVAGIFLGTEFKLPIILILIGLIPLPLLLFLRQHYKLIVLTSLGLITFFGATVYSYSSQQVTTESDLQFYNDREITEIRGMVSKDPELRDKSARLYLSAEEIKTGEEWQAVKGTALIYLPRYSSYEYGDMLHITGDLETPSQFEDFDYEAYLAHQGIYSVMFYPEVEIEARGNGLKPLEWIYSLRSELAKTLSMALPEPQASLAQGIILGIRGNIPLSVKTDFTHTGTAHLLAISGLHLSIIAGILLSIGIWLFGRRHYLYVWLALGTIWLYALLTGMHSPVVRGAIMASLFLIAELLGRQRSAITALTFAAAIMVGISPCILGDAAFQLSFLAMAGLIFLFPLFQMLGRKVVKSILGEDGAMVSSANLAGDCFSATLAAIIAVWPVIAYYFGIISFVGPLATFLALPALPGIVITGALTGALGLIFLPAAQILGWLSWLFLSYLLLVVNTLAASSISFIEVGSVDTTLLWIYYSVLAAVVFFSRKKLISPMTKTATGLKSGISKSFNLVSRLPKKWVIPPLLLVAILTSLTAATMPDDNLHISFLDIGQGDAILIQQGNHQVLVDGGPSPQAISLALGKQMLFWDRTIDLVVLTHPDSDHLAGLIEVLQRFQVNQVLYPDLNDESLLYMEWSKLVEGNNIKRNIAQAGQQIKLSRGAVIKVLHPQATYLTGTESDTDNNGVVLRLDIKKVSFLLTADIMQEAEWELTQQRAELTSTVLKVAHHGSNTSTTPEFLAVVDPQLAVISVGADNRFGHPGDEVLERLEKKLGVENIYRTDQHGTIEFITDGERLWVEVER